MIIPINSPRVTIRLLASSIAYPFLIATPEIIYPMAFKTQKTGMEMTLMIKGPINGTMAISAPNPAKIWVKILTTNVMNRITFLSMP